MELLKRFQGIRGELSGTLQRAESTISEHASYIGKDNLRRLHSKVNHKIKKNQSFVWPWFFIMKHYSLVECVLYAL